MNAESAVADANAPRFGVWEIAAAATVAVASTIAMAPVLGLLPVVVVSLLWFVAVGYFVAATLWRRARHWSLWHWTFAVGVGAAIVRLCSLGLVQLYYGRASLYWNVDWRYAATLAQGISRFSGLGDSLDYAGEPVRYHAGPSWIAGGLDATVGAPIDVVLFLIVPAVCAVVVGVGAYRLLRAFGAPGAPAMVGVAVALNLPRDPVGLANSMLHGDLDVLVGARTWAFGASLILNGLLALAVGFAAASLLTRSRSHVDLALGGAGLATLVAIKPQYFATFAVIVGLVYLVLARREAPPVPWSTVALLALWVVALSGAFAIVTPQVASFSDVDVVLPDGLRQLVDPSGGSYFSTRLLRDAIVCIGIFSAVPFLRRVQGRRLFRSALTVAVSAAVILVAVDGTTFLISPDQFRRINRVGLDVARDWLDANFSQALLPLTMIVVMVAATQVAIALGRLRSPLRFAPAAIVAFLVIGTLPTTLSALRHPMGRAAIEPTEEAALSDLLDRVDTTDGVWLSSDLADSADGFAYPLLGVNLTAIGDAQFYLADVVYAGRSQTDVVERVRKLRRFFETPWSAWHERFLRDERITHVIVRDRCPPAWEQDSFPGAVVGREGDWTLLEVGEPRTDPGPSARIWPEYTGVARYGRAACLSGPFSGS